MYCYHIIKFSKNYFQNNVLNLRECSLKTKQNVLIVSYVSYKSFSIERR